MPKGPMTVERLRKGPFFVAGPDMDAYLDNLVLLVFVKDADGLRLVAGDLLAEDVFTVPVFLDQELGQEAVPLAA
jgi:hypothetical protein